jgi:hypothetical protein
MKSPADFGVLHEYFKSSLYELPSTLPNTFLFYSL